MAASASMPPTPHPATPTPLIIVVCESVPTTESGYSRPLLLKTTRARYSRFTWCTIPEPGGTISRLSKAVEPHFRNWKRSRLRSISRSWFTFRAPAEPAASTCTEWSITRSTGICGLIFDASPPRRFVVSRMAARSTTHGTPVKSCSTTRAGLNGISIDFVQFSFQLKISSTVLEVTSNSSQLRTADSSSTRMLNGSSEYFVLISLTL
mmetsp:Transcript_6420/g.7201  ORF Transcript_6420/g.7201 Transcript_6420/m.7201 type:complete len:208 (-) Transcript_6420:137-760(-)